MTAADFADLAPAHARLGHSEPRDYCWYCTETEKMTDDDVIPCACGSTETVELSNERQSITICANCGSDS